MSEQTIDSKSRNIEDGLGDYYCYQRNNGAVISQSVKNLSTSIQLLKAGPTEFFNTIDVQRQEKVKES